jgi:pimeloyl-ACP methyl ester carboxylesterase
MSPNEGYVRTDDGVRLYVLKRGSGEQHVLVPNGLYLWEDFEPLAVGRTLVFFDLRNRGRSDAVADAARLQRGIHNDVDDLDAVRRDLGVDRVDLIGHSYVGMTVALYAMKYTKHASRVVQIGASAPDQRKEYPPELANADDTLRRVLAQLAELQKERKSCDPVAFCERFWSVLAPIFVADPAHAARIHWGRCDLPNERGFMKYNTGSLLPSIRAVALTAADLAHVVTPVLTVHGRLDRSAPYGGGRDWARLLPNARLLTVEKAAHAPWIEAPGITLGGIATFLDGGWPQAAETVE